MIELYGSKNWRIENIKTPNTTFNYFKLYDISTTLKGDFLNVKLKDIYFHSITGSTKATNAIDGDDSTYVQSGHNAYSNWWVELEFYEPVWLDTISFLFADGMEMQTADIKYLSGYSWVLYENIKPMLEIGFSGRFTINLTGANIIDYGVTDINSTVIKRLSNELPFQSMGGYISKNTHESVKLNIYSHDETRIIRGKTRFNGDNKISLYDKKYRNLVATVNTISDIFIFKNLDINKSYYAVDSNHSIVYDTDYEGKETIKGFVEGVTEPVKVALVDKYGNELEHQSTTSFEFENYNLETLKGNIKIGDTLTPVEYYLNQQRGYISASVVIGECGDSDFVIHCFRSSDKQFIGEYPIIDDRYTIDNLNLTHTYDIMLHDKNKIVETQVHSRRTPSIYQ